MLWALACMAAVVVVFFLRPPRARALTARVVVGDAVSTDDELVGIVVRLDGPFALVDLGDGRFAWSATAGMMEPDPALPLPTRSPATDEPTFVPPSPATLVDSGSTLHRFAAGVWTARRTIVGGWICVILAVLPLAATAEHSFINGGFLPESGEAMDALDEIQYEFHMPVGQQTVIVPGPIDEATASIRRITPDLLRTPHVAAVGKPRASSDGELVAVTIMLASPDERSADSWQPILDEFGTAFPDAKLHVAGTVATYVDSTEQTKRDLQHAELVGIPLAMLVLLFVFGTAVAAAVPLLVGVASVVLTLAILHLLSLPLELSIFVMNIATMLGFGLGIDYSLLGVSRFRDELAAGATTRDAVITTITTSGRAAAISGVAVLAGVAALAVIPLPVMFAIAIGGVVVVAVTVLASITLLPAILGVLGPNIERLAIRRPRATGDITQGRWYRLTHAVMRRPGTAITLGVGVLLVLASPTLGARLEIPHEEVLSGDAPSVVATRTLAEEFGERVESPVTVIARTADEAKITELRAQLLTVDHLVRTEVIATDSDRDSTLLNAWGDASIGTGGAEARATAKAVSELETVVPITVTGQGAGEREFLAVIREGMPRTLVLIFASTLIILTIAFRSFTIPIKAIVLDTLSILAALGTVVAVFQNGHGIELLGGEPLGYTECTIPIILFALLFGLSMDYEVFMLAKVTELYQAGHDDREATARGVASTAPLVTGAALILIVVGIAFATTQLILVKQIGFGMAVALALDATIVRVLLLPATMRLLGPHNWWLPRALQRRIPRVSWAH